MKRKAISMFFFSVSPPPAIYPIFLAHMMCRLHACVLFLSVLGSLEGRSFFFLSGEDFVHSMFGESCKIDDTFHSFLSPFCLFLCYSTISSRHCRRASSLSTAFRIPPTHL